MGQSLRAAIAAVVGIITLSGMANAQTDPPGRIGRLAYTNGTVSFHDAEQTQWAPAVVNTPLTTGDSLWTEPNARSEITIAGTRVRMDGATELDLLAVDDRQVRLQVPQGRLDIKAAAVDVPYQVVTPRGTVALQQRGDYYIESGSTQDATRLGVRSGAAQITGLNGATLQVRAGEVGELSGAAGTPVLRTVRSAPPPMEPYWADRDRQISYDQPPQYLPATVTGYEDLNAYGSWSNQGNYGQVWTPREVPSGWAPYRNGHWSYVRPWGWTWVDEQPWGFAPFHYGRWVNDNNRWSWVPPGRETRPVYAPALVSFIGAAANLLLGSNASNQNPSVGWFPLGPREVYVPSYTSNRDYFRSINRSNINDQALIDARYQWAQQRETAARANDPRFTYVNQRFATVVPQEAFQRSQPMARVAIQVAPEKLAAAPVAPVAAPPVAVQAAAPVAKMPDGKPADPKAQTEAKAPPDAKAQADAKASANVGPANVPVVSTPLANMPSIGKPMTTDKPAAPGPKVVTRAAEPQTGAKASTTPSAGPAKAIEAPPLAPRAGAAPPMLKDDKAVAPATPDVVAKPAEPAGKPEPPKPPGANENKGAALPPPTAAPTPPANPVVIAKPKPAKPEPPKAPAVENKDAALPPPVAAPTPPANPVVIAKPEPAAKPEPPKAPAVENKGGVAPPPIQQPAQIATQPVIVTPKPPAHVVEPTKEDPKDEKK